MGPHRRVHSGSTRSKESLTILDPEERRRKQNRDAQRNYRKKQKQRREEEASRRAQPAEQQPPSHSQQVCTLPPVTDESRSGVETYQSQPQQCLRYPTQSLSWAYPSSAHTPEFPNYMPNNTVATNTPRPVSSQPSLSPTPLWPQDLENGDSTHRPYPFYPAPPPNSWWPSAFNVQDDTTNALSEVGEQDAQEKVGVNMGLEAYWIPGRSTYK